MFGLPAYLVELLGNEHLLQPVSTLLQLRHSRLEQVVLPLQLCQAHAAHARRVRSLALQHRSAVREGQENAEWGW